MDFNEYLNNLLYSPGMGIAAGLLSASGPSREPVSLGQALGAGFQSGQQFQGLGLQNAMQQIELQKQRAQLGFLNGMNQPQGPGNPNDPTSDPTYQMYLKGAMAGIPGMGEAANNQLAALRSKLRPATDEEVKRFFPQGVLPGQSVLIDGYGNPQIKGDLAIKDVTDYDPVTLQPIHHYKNLLTGKDVFPSQTGPAPVVPGQPLPGPYESIAQQVANYDVKPPTAGSGRGAAYAANILARAHEINPDFDAKNYDMSLKAVKDFGTGKEGQQAASATKSLSHLDLLSQMGVALQNGDLPAVNYLKNSIASAMGKAPPGTFDAVKQIAMDEVTKFIIGSGGGVSDRDKAQALVSSSKSPEQLSNNLHAVIQLMGGQLASLKQMYERTTFRKDFDNKVMGKNAMRALQNAGVNLDDTGQSAPAAVNWSDLK